MEKSLHLGPKISKMVEYNRSCTPTTLFQHFISGTTNIIYALLNAQQAHYICSFTSQHAYSIFWMFLKTNIKHFLVQNTNRPTHLTRNKPSRVVWPTINPYRTSLIRIEILIQRLEARLMFLYKIQTLTSSAFSISHNTSHHYHSGSFLNENMVLISTKQWSSRLILIVSSRCSTFDISIGVCISRQSWKHWRIFSWRHLCTLHVIG
jgi:hypothetical protein